MVSFPSVPASRELSPYSSPPAPTPAALVKPITGEARLPLGTTRLASSIRVMPGKASAEIFCPVEAESCLAKTT